MAPQKQSVALRIAVVLCWFTGIFTALSAVAIGIPAIDLHPTDPVAWIFPGFLLVVGVVYCLCGRGIRRNSWRWGFFAAAISACFLVLNLFTAGWFHAVLLPLSILVCLMAGWSRLGNDAVAPTGEKEPQGSS